MWHRFKAKLAPFPKQFLWLAVIAMIIAAVVVFLALWFTFIPQMPPTLEEIRSDTLADATEETYIAPPSGDRSFWDSGDDAPVELSVDPPKPAEPEIEQAEQRQEVLDQVATVTEAPDVLSPDEVAFVEAQMKAENAKPEDVVLAISRKRRTRSPKFLDQPPDPEPTAPESLVGAAKTAAPGYVSLGFRPKPAIYPIGHALEARLLSDIVAIQGLATVALVEVFAPSGKPLGTSLVNVNLAPRGRAVVHLEGNMIADPENRGIRGNFRAFSPNGQVGLLGETKTYWLRHVGMTLYRTALGILPLRLADQDNTLAGIIGAQAGSAILKDLAGDVQRAPDRRTFIPRGTRFHIVFTSPARLPDRDADGFDPSRPDFTQAARETSYLGRERERAIFELANRFRQLDQSRSATNQTLSFENALSDPGSVLGVLQEAGQ